MVSVAKEQKEARSLRLGIGSETNGIDEKMITATPRKPSPPSPNSLIFFLFPLLLACFSLVFLFFLCTQYCFRLQPSQKERKKKEKKNTNKKTTTHTQSTRQSQKSGWRSNPTPPKTHTPQHTTTQQRQISKWGETKVQANATQKNIAKSRTACHAYAPFPTSQKSGRGRLLDSAWPIHNPACRVHMVELAGQIVRSPDNLLKMHSEFPRKRRR